MVTDKGTCEPSDYTERDHPYGYTVNVYPHKWLSSVGFKSMKWMDIDNKAQRQILTKVLGEAIHTIGKTGVDICYTFENTVSGHAHVHGLISCSEKQIKVMQDIVCKYLGLPKVDKGRCFNYTKTMYDKSFWYKYMTKESSQEVVEEETEDMDTDSIDSDVDIFLSRKEREALAKRSGY